MHFVVWELVAGGGVAGWERFGRRVTVFNICVRVYVRMNEREIRELEEATTPRHGPRPMDTVTAWFVAPLQDHFQIQKCNAFDNMCQIWTMVEGIEFLINVRWKTSKRSVIFELDALAFSKVKGQVGKNINIDEPGMRKWEKSFTEEEEDEADPERKLTQQKALMAPAVIKYITEFVKAYYATGGPRNMTPNDVVKECLVYWLKQQGYKVEVQCWKIAVPNRKKQQFPHLRGWHLEISDLQNIVRIRTKVDEFVFHFRVEWETDYRGSRGNEHDICF